MLQVLLVQWSFCTLQLLVLVPFSLNSRGGGGGYIHQEGHLYMNSGRWYLSHVPSTFATVNYTHANVFFVFLPGGISKEWRQIVSANCDFETETGPIVPMFTGLSGNTWETAKIAHESHNDVRRLCWCHLCSAGQTWDERSRDIHGLQLVLIK